MDSVDEARLRNPSDFELAIRKLGRRIITALDRTHIVITGRATAWRPKTDLALCVRHLPFTPATTTTTEDEQTDDVDDPAEDIETVYTEDRAKNKEKPIFKIVALDDLGSDQIEVFAGARGITDKKSFLEEVERADAWSFTARLQDLETEFWIDQGRIGSRLEIMRNSIDRRLAERDQGRADARPLAAQRARQAARLIAAAATMAQEPKIRVPDGADNTRGTGIQAVLPDWDDKGQSTLLSRPILMRRFTARFDFTIARFASNSRRLKLFFSESVWLGRRGSNHPAHFVLACHSRRQNKGTGSQGCA
jgi:hypothetical protein